MSTLNKQQINEKLELIRPFLVEDGGDVEIIEITDSNQLKIKLIGNCSVCSKKEHTIRLGIENILKQFFPEITVIEV